MCKVDGCDSKSVYKAADVCQKHYFRFMRNGTYDLVRKPRKQFERYSPNGYRVIYKPGHPVANKSGWASEHRVIFYDNSKSKSLNCEFCGAEWTFRPFYDHVDHIDEDKLNNDLSNLRPLCNRCNTSRTKRVEHKYKNNHPITWNGETKTSAEWGRDERIPVAGSCIRQRLSRGYSVEEAFFSEKITHRNSVKIEARKV